MNVSSIPPAAGHGAWPSLTVLSEPTSTDATARVNAALWASLDGSWLRVPAPSELSALLKRQEVSAGTCAAWRAAVIEARYRAAAAAVQGQGGACVIGGGVGAGKRARETPDDGGDDDVVNVANVDDGSALMWSVDNDYDNNDNVDHSDRGDEDPSLILFLPPPPPFAAPSSLPFEEVSISPVKAAVNVAAFLSGREDQVQVSQIIPTAGSGSGSGSIIVNLCEALAACGAVTATNAARLSILHAAASRGAAFARVAALALAADAPALVASVRAVPGCDAATAAAAAVAAPRAWGGSRQWATGSPLAAAAAGAAPPPALLRALENALAALDGPTAELELSRSLAKSRARASTWRWGVPGDKHMEVARRIALDQATRHASAAAEALECQEGKAPALKMMPAGGGGVSMTNLTTILLLALMVALSSPLSLPSRSVTMLAVLLPAPNVRLKGRDVGMQRCAPA